MTKEEKIKEAWGLAYDEVENLLTENGYIPSVDLAHIGLNLSSYNLDLNYNDIGVRPKSLQGIENNNGWIKIESEDDLHFMDYEDLFVIINNKIELFSKVIKLRNEECGYFEEDITHYQPIEKPKPPIY